MPDQTQPVVPCLFYTDAAAAIAFLCQAFGFKEEFRHAMPDGKIGFARLGCEGGGAVTLASVWPEGGFASPLELPAVHSQVYCNVDDTDAHYERAKAAGATIAAEPADQYGGRSYRAIDPEGHRWIFAGPKRSGT
jgi:uncharacterized glyoxalase superfamily protein PhnB